MTAAARKIAAVPNAPSPLEVLIARAQARALLWQAGEFARAQARAILWAASEFDLHDAIDDGLHHAIDVLWRAAERDGLVRDLGADRVQQLLADKIGRAHV